MVLVEEADSLVQLSAPMAFGDAEVKQVNVGIQGELVHGVDLAHVVQDKEEDGGPLSTGAVGLAGQSARRGQEQKVHQKTGGGALAKSLC